MSRRRFVVHAEAGTSATLIPAEAGIELPFVIPAEAGIHFDFAFVRPRFAKTDSRPCASRRPLVAGPSALRRGSRGTLERKSEGAKSRC